MSEYLKVIDHTDLMRHANSKAIVNKDTDALNKYKEERELRTKLVQVANEHDEVKKEVREIKSMLQTILERISG
jgi:hypothetical protein